MHKNKGRRSEERGLERLIMIKDEGKKKEGRKKGR
jgi:hypothetical protein